MDGAQARALFAAISTEFAGIGEGIEGLAALVSDHLRQASPPARSEALRQAQAIDALTQRCRALQDLTHAMSKGRTLSSALADVPLTDLSSRLTDVRPARHPGAASGDLVLFD